MKNQLNNFGIFLFNHKSFKKYSINPNLKNAKKLTKSIKNWAKHHNVTHFSHWFIPLDHIPAEKRISFFKSKNEKPIYSFSATDLLSGEVDASSFPSLSPTHSARGKLVFDTSFPPFIKEDSNKNRTLFIPSCFFDGNNLSLDERTPLLRALSKLDKEATLVANLLGHKNIKHVNLMVGVEQEYFLHGLSSKQNRHYCAPLSDKISAYMCDLSKALARLGIIACQQHSEVAPAQFELVQLFDRANISADQNALVMQTISQVAARHGFVADFYEKPFENQNGSGKHLNLSLLSNTGINFFAYSPKTQDLFFVFICAFVEAAHTYTNLLLASVSTPSNDLRLGGHEAPPKRLSVYLGDNLTKCLSKNDFSNFDVSTVNRNRTSPLAFTGNRFEFRMLGSNGSVHFASTCFAVALTNVLKKYAISAQKTANPAQNLINIAKNSFSAHKKVVFNGNCYSLSKQQKTDSLSAFISKKVISVFESLQVLSKSELVLRHQLLKNAYIKQNTLDKKPQ